MTDYDLWVARLDGNNPNPNFKDTTAKVKLNNLKDGNKTGIWCTLREIHVDTDTVPIYATEAIFNAFYDGVCVYRGDNHVRAMDALYEAELFGV